MAGYVARMKVFAESEKGFRRRRDAYNAENFLRKKEAGTVTRYT
jgi:hypothetical protein